MRSYPSSICTISRRCKPGPYASRAISQPSPVPSVSAAAAFALPGWCNADQPAMASRLCESKTERTPASLASGFDPDASAMHLDDALDQGQANPCAVALWLQPFEETKDLLMIPWVNPHTVVLHIVDRFFLFLSTANLDPRGRLRPHKLDGVVHEVLQHLQEPGAISHDHGQVRRNMDLHPARSDLPCNQCHGLVRQGAERYLGQWVDHTANPRQLEQFVQETLHGGCSRVNIGDIRLHALNIPPDG